MLSSFPSSQLKTVGLYPDGRKRKPGVENRGRSRKYIKVNEPVKKLYWKMTETAKMLGIATSAIQFYDDEFGLQIHRGRRNYRTPTREDIGKLAVIVGLRACGISVEKIKQYHSEGRAENVLETLEPGYVENILKNG